MVILECDNTIFKIKMRDDPVAHGCDIKILFKNGDLCSICGIICENDFHVLKTWGNSSDILSSLGLDTHFLNMFNRIKIVGVDEL